VAVSSYVQRFLPGNAQKPSGRPGTYSARFDPSTAPRVSSSTFASHSTPKFNYAAFGNDLLEEPSRQVAGTIQSLSNSRNQPDYVARPDDPEVRDYMSNIIGGQRKLMDEYVKRAANSGTRRGGMNAAGGPALDSALHHDAMKNLASDYANRFSEGMNYGRYAKGAQYGQERDRMNNLQNLFGIQRGYLTARQNRQDRIAELQRQDWLTELANARTKADQTALPPEPAVNRQPAATQSSPQTDPNRGWLEIQWKALLHKMDANPYHWSRSDGEKLEFLGNQLGYMTPWKRSLTAIVK
jgi:hypothetical protein